jgi:hypothetical protein
MPLPRLTERTLYPELVSMLGSQGMESLAETEVGERFPDLIVRYQSERYVVQVRIGDEKDRHKLVRDAFDAAYRLGVKNVITMLYPESIRRKLPDQETLRSITHLTPIISDTFSEHLTQEIRGNAESLIRQIRDSVDRNLRETDIGLSVQHLSGDVQDLAEVLRRVEGPDIEPALQSVVGRFDLFMALAEKTENELRIAGLDLLAYLLLNQVLFYHIYAAKTGKVDALPARISSARELSKTFDSIRKIDFQPIYSMELTDQLPPKDPALLTSLNAILTTIQMIRPENMRLDLLGRFFHELLPWKSRKILAAFYTEPNSASMLAGLAIEEPHAKLLDLACGSGTLLVAGYHRKFELVASEPQDGPLHDRMLREITGIDIMPFATHLTAVNLSVQDPEHEATHLRISVENSLNLRRGAILKPFSRQLQKTLYGVDLPVRSGGTISLTTSLRRFSIDTADVLIINPPFTDREKMPADLRAELNAESGTPELRRRIRQLISVAGGASNLWVYFLVQADRFLEPSGTLAAVLPTNILRGQNTEAIRTLLLENYSIRYLVRASKDYGFSEGSELRDMLVVAVKQPPSMDEKTAVVWLRESIRSISQEKVKALASEISSTPQGKEVSSENYDLSWLRLSDLRRFRHNLTPLLSYASLQNQRTITSFIRDIIRVAGEKLTLFRSEQFYEGFHTSPKGRSKALCVTNPISVERLEHALMRLGQIVPRGVEVAAEHLHFVLPSTAVRHALRSLTSLSKFDIGGEEDYLVVADFPDFPSVAGLAGWKGPMDWARVLKEATQKETRLAIARKFNLYSPNFHLFGFYRDDPYVPFDFLKGVRVQSPKDAKILCAYFNSIAFLAQAYAYREETQVRYPELREEDLVLIPGPNLAALEGAPDVEAGFLKAFEELRHQRFPDLTTQFETRDPARVSLDTQVLTALGFEPSSVPAIIDSVYAALVREFKATRGLRKGVFRVY